MPSEGRRKRESLLRMLQKILSLALAVSMMALIGCAAQEQKDCCLCDSFRYHAPCLIDLETGEMIELDLYFLHETKVAELSDLYLRWHRNGAAIL